MGLLLDGEKVRSIHVMKKRIWTPARKVMEGRVSDIKVFDNYNPRTGEGKLVDYHKGGHNTISSGATATMLEYMFAMFGDSYQNRYFDGTNYFPGTNDLAQGATTSATGMGTANPFAGLFKSIVGIKGGSAGLNGKQSALTGLTPAWVIAETSSGNTFVNGDTYTVCSDITKNITMTRSLSTAGQPAQYTWNVTVTSAAAASQYTIDSIAWIPGSVNGGYYYSQFVSAAGGSLNTTNPNSVWSVNSTSYAPAVMTNAPPTNMSAYITALFVLPYLITVNPNGAFQFTYTFQGN